MSLDNCLIKNLTDQVGRILMKEKRVQFHNINSKQQLQNHN